MKETIGRYRLKREIGRGGMATVYQAFDPAFKRDVAVKVLPHAYLHDPQFKVRFEREATTIAGLEHLSIVPVYDFGEDDGQPYLVMRFMEGGALTDRIRERPLTLDEISQIVLHIAPAIDLAHRKGIIHRDIKPDNILFDTDGNPYLSDFGIVKLSEGTTHLSAGMALGTPAYMSPEQAKGEGEISGQSDIYSLGITVFEALTGSLPFAADTPLGVVLKHITEPPPDISTLQPEVPEEISSVIQRALQKDATDRFRTASEFAEAFSAGSTIQPTPVPDFSDTRLMPKEELDVKDTLADIELDALPQTEIIDLANAQNKRRPTLAWLIAPAVLLLLATGAFLFREPLGFGGGNQEPAPVANQEEAALVPSIEAKAETIEPTAILEPATSTPEPTLVPTDPAPTETPIPTKRPTLGPVQFTPLQGDRQVIGRGVAYEVAASPTENLFAIASSLGISLFQLDQGAEPSQKFIPTNEIVYDINFTADGEMLVSLSNSGFKLWNVRTQALIREIPKQTASGSLEMALTKDGRLAALVLPNRKIEVWELEKSQLLITLELEEIISAVSFLTDESELVTASRDGQVIIWDWENGEQRASLEGHTDSVSAIALSADGTRLVTGGREKNMILWDVESGEEVDQLIGHDSELQSLVFSADGTTLYSGGRGELLAWDLNTNRIQREFPVRPIVGSHKIALSANNAILLTTGSSPQFFNVENGVELITLDRFMPAVSGLSTFPNGNMIISAYEDGYLRLWSSERRNLVNELEPEFTSAGDIVVSPTGEFSAVKFFDEIILYDRENQSERLRLSEGRVAFTDLDISQDGRYLAAGDFDGVAHIWETESGNLIVQLKGHSSTVQGVAFSPDGRYLATGGADAAVIVWDVETGNEVSRLTKEINRFSAVRFSPDGALLVAGADREIVSWQVDSWESGLSYLGHSGFITDLIFSADGGILYSASVDKSIRVWEVGTGQQLDQLEGHTDWVTKLAIQGESTLVSGGRDGTIRIWE